MLAGAGVCGARGSIIDTKGSNRPSHEGCNGGEGCIEKGGLVIYSKKCIAWAVDTEGGNRPPVERCYGGEIRAAEGRLFTSIL